MLSDLFSFLIKDTTCYDKLVTALPSHSIALLVYSHIPAAIITLAVGIFLLIQSTHLKIRIFFSLSITLFVFILADLAQQLTFLGQDTVMFAQTLLQLLEPLIVILSFYFLYYLIKRKDAAFHYKVVGLMPLIPIYVAIALQQTFLGYDAHFCKGIENPLWTTYLFFVSFGYLILAFGFCIASIIKNKPARKEIATTSIGGLLFITLFFVTQNIFTGRLFGQPFNSDYSIYAFFCIPLVVTLLAYLAVRFKVFKVRLVTSQIFILSVFVLIFCQFFFLNNTVSVILNTFLIFFMIVISHIVISEVRQEVDVREHVEELALNLSAANQNLKKTNIKLEELNLQKTEFVSLATHQIRGPLESVKGYASMILEGDFGPISKEVKGAMETMARASQSLVIIVDDYLDVSRMEQGKMKFDFAPFDMKTLLKAIMDEFKPLVRNAHLELCCECDENKAYVVNADMDKVKQVLMNLLDNSIKYTPKGNITIKLEKKEGRKILFSTHDTGVGIPAEVIPQLFARFSRAPDASKTNMRGTGLGLYVAKKIIEAHNGRIWTESAGEGKGTQFYVELNEA